MYGRTVEYFNLSPKELSAMKDNGLTKEESLLFDEGLKTVFFDHFSNLEEYIEQHLEDFKVKAALKTITGKFALVLF